jgi:hypothetical protein
MLTVGVCASRGVAERVVVCVEIIWHFYGHEDKVSDIGK